MKYILAIAVAAIICAITGILHMPPFIAGCFTMIAYYTTVLIKK